MTSHIDNQAVPAHEQPGSSPAQRRRWKLWGILVGGVLVIGVIGAVTNPEQDIDAAPPVPTSGPPSNPDTMPPTTVGTTTTIGSPTTVLPSPTVAPALPRPAPVDDVPVVPVPAPTAVHLAGYTVRDVVDGDTIDVVDESGFEHTVRLIGIDTPEMDSCGGPPARTALAALVASQQIALTVGGDGEDMDRYGRLLRYVDVAGEDAGLSLIEQSFAVARYDSRDGHGRHDREDAYITADAASPDQVCAVAPAPVAALPPATATAPISQTPPPADVYYENCTAVKAAGAAPIHPGDPGWQSKFDRDNDGIGCES